MFYVIAWSVQCEAAPAGAMHLQLLPARNSRSYLVLYFRFSEINWLIVNHMTCS